MTLRDLHDLLVTALETVDEGTEVRVLKGAVYQDIYRMHISLPDEELYLEANEHA